MLAGTLITKEDIEGLKVPITMACTGTITCQEWHQESKGTD